MDKKQQEMYEALTNLDADCAVDILLDYHGTQLLDDGFYEHLENEGIIYG